MHHFAAAVYSSFDLSSFCSLSEYVDLYVDWMLNKSIYSQFKAFYHGFHTVCASNALIVSYLYSVDKMYEPRHEISNNLCNQQSIRSACSYAQSDQSLC